MARFVIIGAGLTGLSTAYHLEQHGITDYALFEKESEPGGLCRSVRTNGFTFDYTGHLLHTSDSYFHSLVQHLMGPAALASHQRNAAIYSHQTYTDYPFQQHLYGLPPDVITECIHDFATREPQPHPDTSYKQWILHHFGRGFGTHFFFPYQSKLFDYPLEQLTARWTGRFVPSTQLKTVIKGALTKPLHTDAGYNATFLYPQRGGIDHLVASFARTLTRPIATQHCVNHIDYDHRCVYFSNGTHEQYEHLITTMPLNNLATCCRGTNDGTLHAAAANLACSSVININIGLKKELPPYHWLYFPETAYPFYRIGIPSNLGSCMAPPEHTSLSIEIGHHQRSHSWQQRARENAYKKIQKLFSISDHHIVTTTELHLPHAYVLYDQARDSLVTQLHTQLAKHNIYSVGRYGSWHYESMQEAVLAGKKTADTLACPPPTTTLGKQSYSYQT